MNRNTERSLIERALVLLAERRSDMAAQQTVLDPGTYTAPERHQAELTTVFRRFPLLAGFSSQLTNAGDTLTTALGGLGVLVVRNREGGLHAFVNACRHRGVRLVDAPCQLGQRSFRCRFHGWTYDLAGRRVHLPGGAGFSADDADARLVPLPVDERAGLIFVLPTPGATMDLDAWLGEVGADLVGLGLGERVMVRPTRHERAHNWKMYMDATLESYHIPVLHASTAGAGWFASVGVFDHLRPHARAVLPEPSLTELEDTDPATWRLRDHAGLLYAIFPNTTVLIHKGSVQVMTAHPGAGPSHSEMRGASLAPSDESVSAAGQRHAYYDTYWQTMNEDFEVLESMQRSLESGAIERLLVGRQEHLVADYHAAIRDAIEGECFT